MRSKREKKLRRKKRIRKKLFGTASSPRLTVFKSARHIYAQIIDDTKGSTLVSASTCSKKKVPAAGTVKGSTVVGEMIAEKAKAKGITKVVFDRNGFKYQGRVKALADASREKGLKF